jgi:nitrogen fixation NifU-like protein
MSAAELYQAAIKSLAQADTGHGRLDAPAGRALADNPLCGDRIEVDVELAGARIAALAHRVKGCLLCRASASVLGRRAPGVTPQEIERVAGSLEAMLAAPPGAGWESGWEELAAFAPVRGHRSRYGCVLLPFRALRDALGAAAGGSSR